ncbi:MAG: GTP-binding protein [Leptolyngbya sp.]|nr:GTP-binding protein [Leptolyngbya sp.]
MTSPLLLRTRDLLGQVTARYAAVLPLARGEGAVAMKTGLDQLQGLQTQVAGRRLTVAVFGRVSRGKSAVINALMGEAVLETGPLHGVTRWPRSVYWQPQELAQADGSPWQVELVDTPGLDEEGGGSRAEMAQTVAQQADLILFVVAGEVTTAEYRALVDLYRQNKPLLLVLNKMDLYPEVDRQTIYADLNHLRQTLALEVGGLAPLAVDEVVMVAASPAPVPVRMEWPDGRHQEVWESPAPQVEALRQALLTLIQRDGETLVALNTLHRARILEVALVGQVAQIHGEQAEAIIWRFAKYKALAVALNPIVGLDVVGGVLSDLVMIRTLARIYGFPLTNHEAGHLWKAILKSSGALLLSELGSGLLGAGKTTAALLSWGDSATGITALAGAITAQASAAGYGSYAVGKAAKTYLERGCTWGPEGISATLATILQEAKTSPALDRLRQELSLGLAVDRSVDQSTDRSTDRSTTVPEDAAGVD